MAQKSALDVWQTRRLRAPRCQLTPLTGDATAQTSAARAAFEWHEPVGIAQHLPDIVLLLNDFDDCVYGNEQWTRYTGTSMPSAQGHLRWHSFLHPKDHAYVALLFAKNRHVYDIEECEVQIRAADGTYAWHLMHIVHRDQFAPPTDIQGRWLGVAVKIKQVDAQLPQVCPAGERRASDTPQAPPQSVPLAPPQHSEAIVTPSLELFTKGIAHDLRTPMTIISLGVQRLQCMKKPDTQKSARILERIAFNVHRANVMIEELLERAKPADIGQAEASGHRVNLNAVVHELIDNASPSSRRCIKFENSQDVDGAWGVEHLRRITDNLLTNAFKYGDAEGDVTITVTRHDAFAKLSVHNWGAPIPADELDKIFAPLYRCRRAEHDKQPGFGVGLSMVQELVHIYQGEVSVTSDVQTGTTFCVSLPMG